MVPSDGADDSGSVVVAEGAAMPPSGTGTFAVLEGGAPSVYPLLPPSSPPLLLPAFDEEEEEQLPRPVRNAPAARRTRAGASPHVVRHPPPGPRPVLALLMEMAPCPFYPSGRRDASHADG